MVRKWSIHTFIKKWLLQLFSVYIEYKLGIVILWYLPGLKMYSMAIFDQSKCAFTNGKCLVSSNYFTYNLLMHYIKIFSPPLEKKNILLFSQFENWSVMESNLFEKFLTRGNLRLYVVLNSKWQDNNGEGSSAKSSQFCGTETNNA